MSVVTFALAGLPVGFAAQNPLVDEPCETLGEHLPGDGAFEPAEFQYNPLGTVHGGTIATALDSAAGCAVHSVLDDSTGYTSLDLSVKYLHRVTVDTGRVTAEGRVLSRGRSTALAEATLTDGDGRLLAHATSTCALVPIVR